MSSDLKKLAAEHDRRAEVRKELAEKASDQKDRDNLLAMRQHLLLLAQSFVKAAQDEDTGRPKSRQRT
jgi:hypothetical protein